MTASPTRTAIRRVFVADDDAEMRAFLAEQLRASGFEVFELCDGVELLERLQEVRARPLDWPDVLVTDVRMPGHSGLEVLAALRRAGWTTPVVLITAFGDRQLHEQARRLGSALVLNKPFEIEDLHAALLALTEPSSS